MISTRENTGLRKWGTTECKYDTPKQKNTMSLVCKRECNKYCVYFQKKHKAKRINSKVRSCFLWVAGYWVILLLFYVTSRTIKTDFCKILQGSTRHSRANSSQWGLPLSELLPGWVAGEPRCHRRKSADHPRNPSVLFLPPLPRLTWELCRGREGLGQPAQLPHPMTIIGAPGAVATFILTLSGPQKRAPECHQSPG